MASCSPVAARWVGVWRAQERLPKLPAEEVDDPSRRLLRSEMLVGRACRVVVPPPVAKLTAHDDWIDGHLRVARRVRAPGSAEGRAREHASRDQVVD